MFMLKRGNQSQLVMLEYGNRSFDTPQLQSQVYSQVIQSRSNSWHTVILLSHLQQV